MEADFTLVFLHGFTCDNISTNRIANKICNLAGVNCHMLAPDFPAHGTQPYIPINSIDDLASFVRKEVLTSVKGKYAIFGFSMGGMVALKYAELFKDDANFKGIGVWASPVIDFNKSMRFWVRVLSWRVFEVLPEVLIRRLQNFGPLVKLFREWDMNLPALNKKQHLQIAKVLSTAKFDLSNNTRKCFIYGLGDPAVSSFSFKWLKSLNLPNTELHLVKKGGHFGTKEGLNETYKIFSEFLKKLID